jgi:peptide/nickel transport system substrate-binding protein
MSSYPLAVRSAALLAVVTLGAAACGGSSSGSKSSNGNNNKVVSTTTAAVQGTLGGYGNNKVPLNPGGTKGGTLNIAADSDVDYLDPARTYYAWSWDLHQLINRTVLTYPDSPDPKAGLQTVGDIATGPATGQQNNTVWTYTIKSGIKFQDGTTVTPNDIKYAVERTFATDVINGGPTYFATFLQPKSGPKYAGPYKDKSADHLGLSTITTTSNTITFHLNQPFAEWNYVMTLFGTSPVEIKVDQNKSTGGANYNNHVQATGPYEIKSYAAGKKITLVRNPNYDPSTDGTRPAYPDQIVVTTNMSTDAIDQGIDAGSQDFYGPGTGVQATEQTKILSDPQLKARSLDPVTGFTRYISIFQKVAPFTNINCRIAMEYAINKQEQVRARGGSVGGGSPASTMAPPSLAGYVAFNDYPSTNSEGDVAKAKQYLAKCGHPNGFNMTIVTTNTPKGKAQAEFLQQDLAKINVHAQIKQFDPATYYSSVVGVPANVHKNKYGLAVAGWGPDWPAPYGFFENIIDPRAILQQGNSNYGECDDPKITALITKALAEPTASAELADWGAVDKQVLADACEVPVTYDKALDLFSARLHNVEIQPAFGIVDMRLVAVQ